MRQRPDLTERFLLALLIACTAVGFALAVSWIGDLVQRV